MVLKEFEKLNQEPKGCSWHEEKTKVLLTLFFLFIWVNFWPLSTFVPWKGRRGTWKLFFFLLLLKNGISIKNLFWANLVWKMMSSLNSGCTISIERTIYAGLLPHHSYQKYSGRLFYIYEKPSWKNVYCLLEPYYMVLRLFSLIVPSSHVIATPVCGIRNRSGWYAFT